MSEQFRNEHEQELYLARAAGLYEVAPRASIREVDETAWQAVLAYRARCQPGPIPEPGPAVTGKSNELYHAYLASGGGVR